jgi:2-oxoglutarate ferredoxin oxidoreductase subunit gamma
MTELSAASHFREDIVIAGFGGQGVLFLGQALAWSAFLTGKEVTWLPSYGPEMRGGTANCMVVVSDRMILSPFVRRARVAICLNQPSLLRFAPAVVSTGFVIADTSVVDVSGLRQDLHVVAVPAGDIAGRCGAARLANVVLAGVYAALFPQFISLEAGMAALAELSSGGRAHLRVQNQSALKAGYGYAARCVNP